MAELADLKAAIAIDLGLILSRPLGVSRGCCRSGAVGVTAADLRALFASEDSILIAL
jgi:hypothetical protein